jgi:Abortive infection bacteriophage resistance protein
MKAFKAFSEQLEILKKRELKFENEEFALRKLMEENYYNIINGYKELFIDINYRDEKYLSESTFEEIYALYEFDRDMRNIIFKFILKIENTLRTQISYVFAEKFGCDNYLKFESFDTQFNTGMSQVKIADRAYKVHNLISSLQSDLAYAIKRNDYVKHYVVRHGYVPIWVLVNTITLGRLSSFYTLMKQPERIKVSQHWEIQQDDLKEHIKLLAFYRNLCAHDERLYNTKAKESISDSSIHKILSIEKSRDGRYIYGKNDLYSLMITFKILLKEEDFINLYNKVNGRVISLQKKLNSIPIEKVLDSMGFPLNWREIKES